MHCSCVSGQALQPVTQNGPTAALFALQSAPGDVVGTRSDMTRSDMQSTPTRLPYSPDFEAESSFPERHLDDNKTPVSGIEPGRYPQPAAAKPQVFGPSLAPLYSQGWPSPNRPFFHDSHISPHGPLADATTISSPFPQTSAAVPQPEWASLREQPHNGLRWQPTQPEIGVEDDSDSIQSRNDSIEDFCLSLPTLPSSQKPRRRSTNRVTKPTKPPASVPSHHPAARLDRPYIPDFDYNTDFLDPSDAAAAFFPHINHEHSAPTAGGEIEIAYRDSPSSSKVDSKRIAHKLSEKSRRNRLTIAIREIQKLLPSGSVGDDLPTSQAQKEADYVVRPGVPSSKLDVVEMAVGFIKDLKERNKEITRRLRETERELEGCQCRQGKGGAARASPSGTPTMEDAAG